MGEHLRAIQTPLPDESGKLPVLNAQGHVLSLV
jgi:hypothetical protein